jgi:hypothetical protein
MDGNHENSSPSADKLTPRTKIGDASGLYCSCSALSFRYSEQLSVQYIVLAGKRREGVVTESSNSGKIFPSHQSSSISSTPSSDDSCDMPVGKIINISPSHVGNQKKTLLQNGFDLLNFS